MAFEIERKFLVKGNFNNEVSRIIEIYQGYLSSIPERTVRIRIWDNKGFITIKGKSNASGAKRFEWEKEISVEEARELLPLCEPGIIHKTRHIIPIENNMKFEIDVFYDENQGLILAEIELPEENTSFNKPSWLGKEVTGNPHYYNGYLSKNPYRTWKI
ncbi:MAG: CYTH domain-containing protein [Bacteroidales bacterium]|nr:CYTH domain-containing protein [Bacteroidales bacterium]